MDDKENKYWMVFNNWIEEGPYFVLIIDHVWWDKNKEKIDVWFKSNCPNIKASPTESIFKFETQDQYFAWQLAWSP